VASKPTQREKMPAGVRNIIEDAKDNGIDTAVLLNDLIDCFGGPQRLAAAMHSEFVNAKPGSMVRTRTLEMIARLVSANTQYELTQLKKPSDMNDADLEDEIVRLLNKKELLGGKEAAKTDEAGIHS